MKLFQHKIFKLISIHLVFSLCSASPELLNPVQKKGESDIDKMKDFVYLKSIYDDSFPTLNQYKHKISDRIAILDNCFQKKNTDRITALNQCFGERFTKLNEGVDEAVSDFKLKTTSLYQKSLQEFCKTNSLINCDQYSNAITLSFSFDENPSSYMNEKTNLKSPKTPRSLINFLKPIDDHFNSYRELKKEANIQKYNYVQNLINKLKQSPERNELKDMKNPFENYAPITISENNTLIKNDRKAILNSFLEKPKTSKEVDQEVSPKENQDVISIAKVEEWKRKLSPQVKENILSKITDQNIKANALTPLTLYPIPTMEEVANLTKKNIYETLSQKQLKEIELKYSHNIV